MQLPQLHSVHWSNTGQSSTTDITSKEIRSSTNNKKKLRQIKKKLAVL